MNENRKAKAPEPQQLIDNIEKAITEPRRDSPGGDNIVGTNIGHGGGGSAAWQPVMPSGGGAAGHQPVQSVSSSSGIGGSANSTIVHPAGGVDPLLAHPLVKHGEALAEHMEAVMAGYNKKVEIAARLIRDTVRELASEQQEIDKHLDTITNSCTDLGHVGRNENR